MQPAFVLEFDGQTMTVDDLTFDEMSKIKGWTGGEFNGLPKLLTGVREMDGDALRAVYCVALRRENPEARINDANLPFAKLRAFLIDPDTGREIEGVMELKEDGTLRLNADGDPIPVRTPDGEPKFRYVDTGEDTPPQVAPSTRKSSATRPKSSS